MSLHHKPRIVTDGLVLYLDAANRKSYPGTGTTWFDLSKELNNFELIGTDYIEESPNSIRYTNDEGDYAIRTGGSVVGGLGDLTIDCWINFSENDSVCFMSYATPDQSNAFLMLKDGGVFSIYVDDSRKDIPTPAGFFAKGEFNNYTIVRSGSDILLYKNAELIASATGASSDTIQSGGTMVIGQEQDSVGGEFDTSQDLSADINSYKIYSKALSEQEVKQNFNALRGRFGI